LIYFIFLFAERARSVPSDFATDPIGDAIEGFFPSCRSMLSVFAN